MKYFICVLFFTCALAFSQEKDSVAIDTVKELKEEVSVRDSVMELERNACKLEKDSLRKEIDTEKAKSGNWESSYNTLKKDNERCAQVLGVSLGVNEKKKERSEKDRKEAAMMTTGSFIGGIGLGVLIMWLIMK